jgi:hypothetical protein
MQTKSVLIAGSVAQKPGHAGHTWVFLQWLLGFRRLGFQVLLVDWLTRDICDGAIESSEHLSYLTGVMDRFGLADSFSLLDRETGQAVAGLGRRAVLRRAREAAFLLNVMGFLDDEEILCQVRRRVFLDIDPGFGQMWRELGLADVFHGHDDFVTIGENVGRPGCSIPTCGLPWITTRQPVVLELWPARNGGGDRFTSVGSWRGPFDPIEFKGTTYGLRVHEFRKVLALPRLTNQAFELALEIDESETRDLTQLSMNGWRLVDPRLVAGSPEAYQRYIAGSKAELMIPRGMYVQTRSGWFSDRSACYLASGRPVLAQDTGLAALYPIGEGLLTFTTLEGAVSGAEEIRRSHDLHVRAARSLAEEIFDSDKVLTELLARLGVD